MRASSLGRPRLVPRPHSRVPLGLKVTPEIKLKLDAISRENGRTQSQEAELWLEQAFRDEARAPLLQEAVYGSQTAGLLRLLGETIRQAVPISDHYLRTDDWLSDPQAFAAAAAAIREIVTALQPPGAPPEGTAEWGRQVARDRLELLAAPSAPETPQRLARFGRAVRELLGDPAADRADFHLRASSLAAGKRKGDAR